MKILIMCPFIDSQHAISRRLRASGNALLFPSDIDEAFKMIQLHGVSLDLAIIHREGLGDGFAAAPAGGDGSEDGIRLLGQIKARAECADLPVIVTSTRWNDLEFVRHQQTSQGANAYLRWPFTEAHLVQVIEDMFGSPIRFARGSETQPSITVPTELRSERTDTKTSPRTRATSLTSRPADEPATVMLDDVSALIEAEDKTRTLAPPLPEQGIVQEQPTRNLTVDAGSAGEGETRISLINLAPSPPANGNTDVLGQFGTSMMDGAMAAGPEQGSPGIIELEPPSFSELQGGNSLRGTRPETGPETVDLSDLGALEPHERLLLRNPPPRDGSGAISLSDQSGEGTTKILELGGGKETTVDLITQELHTQGLPGTVTLPPHEEELATIALGTGMRMQSLSGSGSASDEGSLALAELGPQGADLNLELTDGLGNRFDGQEPSVVSTQAPPMEPGPTGPAEPTASHDQGEERQLAEDLPYLFGRQKGEEGPSSISPAGQAAASDPRLFFSEPIGDAVIPGGASQSPDTQTLKKYLLLREQDVAVLSNQLGSTRDQVAALERLLKEERARNLELTHRCEEQKRKLDDATRDKNLALVAMQAEIDEVRFQGKAKTDRARLLEAQVRESGEEIERMKERVRSDIRKIRVRERDLENRLEIMRKDSEALIGAREQKIIELKRKVDMLEFSMDLLQDKHTREKEASSLLRERLARAAQVVRVAGGLLDNQGRPSGQAQDAAGSSAGDSGAGGGDPGGKQEAS